MIVFQHKNKRPDREELLKKQDVSDVIKSIASETTAEALQRRQVPKQDERDVIESFDVETRRS